MAGGAVSQLEALAKKLKELEEANARLQQETDMLKQREDPPGGLSKYLGPTSALRRQFKITGQIGERNRIDKLSYISLVRPVEAGIEQGFTEEEMKDRVI